MTRIAMLLTAVLVAALAAAKMADVQIEESLSWLERDREVSELVDRYYTFKEILDDSLDALEKGRIDLKTAQARVDAAALRYYPKYLLYLTWTEPGATSEERLARNLAMHVRTAAECTPDLQPRARALERELRELLRESAARSTRDTQVGEGPTM